MNFPSNSKAFRAVLGPLASTALTLSLAILGSSSIALADPCLDTAYGGNTGCTANDLAVASVAVTEITDDGCQSPADTVTFNGFLQVAAGSASRYDLGYYIGGEGGQAQIGDMCSVAVIPPGTGTADDGDQCGDYDGGALSVPVTDVTVQCQDGDGNGFFDMPICVSYKQTKGIDCADASEAIPGTSSKCQCTQVTTDVVVNFCVTNADCHGNVGDPCTNAVCNSKASGLGDFFGCTYPPNTAPCDDGLFCNGTDTCSGGSCSVHTGDPCLGGGVCGNSCNETNDNCFVTAGTTCRAAVGVCDTPETCTGSSANCPADGFEPTTTPCGDSSDTVCDNPDTCNGSGSCRANNESTATVCRADAGQCDVAETCDGAGNCPVNGFEPAATPCGSSSDTVCDNPDTCNGSGACNANHESSQTVCRADAGECDVAETCNGSGSCPANGFEPNGTPCGDLSGSVCDSADTCNGAGTCSPNNDPGTTICRPDAGDCDVAEYCDDEGNCPADGFEPAETPCGSGSDTVCDNPDTCDGSGSCDANNESAATVCRADAGDCDVEETCDGAGSCPADGFEPAETACGDSSDTVCDNPDSCDGSGVCNANNESAATVCRADAGECDVEETCDGAGSCPADGFEPAETACGDSSDTVCDNPDSCNGSGSCTANHESSETVCRADTGECDVEETCDGAGSCPADGFEPAETACGDASDTVCDNPDSCNGSGVCIVNNEPAQTVCRGSAGDCDVAESCDGAGSCPADQFLNTECRAAAGVCDAAETCTGSSATCPADSFLNTVCRAAANVCDAAETCTGSNAACPADQFQPADTACTDDGNFCTNDICNGTGTCQHPNNTVPCNDGLFCTTNDTCSNGQCLGSARNCADAVACTTDACNETTDACTHTAVQSACNDGQYCNGVEVCNVQSGCIAGTPIVCSDGVACTIDSCNESTDSCNSSPSNQRCNDENSCTVDTCDAQTGCEHEFACKDLCRPSGFYEKRAGNENDQYNVTQEILDAVGGLEVCGQLVTETSNSESPYLEGLGLDSALEGLCVRTEGRQERALYRELMTTALNCAVSGSDDCDQVVDDYISLSFSECNALCAGDVALTSVEEALSREDDCTRQLKCYNRGGRIINGLCAYGNCDLTGAYCGGDYRTCPPLNVVATTLLQVCERFSDNCRDEEFCQEALDVCPSRLPVSSTRACKEARGNTCTIDSCIDDD